MTNEMVNYTCSSTVQMTYMQNSTHARPSGWFGSGTVPILNSRPVYNQIKYTSEGPCKSD